MNLIHYTAVVEDGAHIGSGVRVWHFAHVRAGATIGDQTQLGKSCYVDSGAVIGARCKIQNFVSVYAGVTLEDEVFVGPSVVFTNDLHPRAVGAWRLETTIVRRGASLGANATILCGIEIGAYAMVADGSVVNRDVGAHELVAGVPARKVGYVCICGRRVGRPTDSCLHAVEVGSP